MVSLHLSRGAFTALGVLISFAILLLVCKALARTPTSVVGNTALTARIKSELFAELGLTTITVEYLNRVVTLRGTAPYANFLGAAEQLARRQGAVTVVNEITIESPATVTTETYLPNFHGVTTPEGGSISARKPVLNEVVRAALDHDSRVNANLIIISVEDGIVYLTGRQDTVQGSSAATEIAERVPGIVGVFNDMEIMSSV